MFLAVIQQSGLGARRKSRCRVSFAPAPVLERADPGEKRRDRRSRRGSRRYQLDWGRGLVRITAMGHSCCVRAGVRTGAAGGRYPQDGLKFQVWYCFQAFSGGGVVFNIPPVVK